MSETELTLYVALKQGARIDMEAAARAQLAWVALARAVNEHLDPASEVSVELASATPGSQRLRSLLRKANDPAGRRVIMLSVGMAAVQFLAAVAGHAVGWGVGEVLDRITGADAPPEVQGLSDEAREELAHMIVGLLNSGAGQAEAREVYRSLEADRQVTGVGVTASPTRRPANIVPREAFPTEVVESAEAEKRTQTSDMELVLVRPVLTADTNRRWQFRSAYGAFGAEVKDSAFLDRVATGTLNVPLMQGIRIYALVEVVEQREGELWRPAQYSIVRVKRIVAPPQQDVLPLTPPQQNDPPDDDGEAEN